MNKIILANGGEAVKAEYREQVVLEYGGNPFIEALPPIFSSDEVVEKIAIYPPYNEKERQLDKQYRVHIVQRLFQCFQPLMIHLDLESRISRIIRQGYLARNPFDPKYISTFQEGYDAIQNMSYDLTNNEYFRSTGAGLTIVGISGIGKTTAINRIITMYPQIIVHSRYKDVKFSMYQLTYLKIDCPHDGSLKGLCVDFFLKIDALLGTDYYKKFGQSRLSVNTMVPVMAQVAKNSGLGMLLIDEVQNLSGAKSGGADKMLNFFVKLTNMGIPTVLIGTPAALSVLQSQFRQARRGSGQGDLVWDRLKKDQSWDLLLNAIWDYQWTRKITPLNKEISDVIYEESQGITDIAVKLYAMSQIRAIISGKEEITTNLIKQVASENFKLVKPMLDALRTGDIKKIAKYEDISTVDTDFLGFLERERSSIDLEMKVEALKRTQRKKEQEIKMSKKEEALLKLFDLNINPDKALKAVDKILKEEGENLEVNEVIVKAIQQISNIENKKRKPRNTEKINEKDIRIIVSDGRKNNLSAYESLKEQGIIKDYESDFLKLGDAV
ncbi:ATP-binding protein [uncultured Clostridium sp.]|uniref:ATP-binding protein n=1 Tax=uncultured Clostridium sp. TaxID=59620 RepID=UPI00258773B7|nr:ATP-binding protein [uncultured Clostridium sp.]MDU1350596.1 ATP-binding protein [Clostridium argentinense]